MYYKHAQCLILVLVFGVVFCSNASLAQTPGDTPLIRSVAGSFVEAYQEKGVDGLIARLLSAKTESEQAALLESERELITVELAQALRKQAETLMKRRELSQALIALRLARLIGETRLLHLQPPTRASFITRAASINRLWIRSRRICCWDRSSAIAQSPPALLITSA
jgi:hypothetical protein